MSRGSHEDRGICGSGRSTIWCAGCRENWLLSCKCLWRWRGWERPDGGAWDLWMIRSVSFFWFWSGARLDQLLAAWAPDWHAQVPPLKGMKYSATQRSWVMLVMPCNVICSSLLLVLWVHGTDCIVRGIYRLSMAVGWHVWSVWSLSLPTIAWKLWTAARIAVMLCQRQKPSWKFCPLTRT